MARHFGYYDDWKSAVLKCGQCGWTGPFQQGSVAHFEELIDASCPVCDTMLAIVSYPTTKESEKNWDQLTDEEKKEFLSRQTWLAEWEAASLKSADQLPDLEGPAFTLVWDMVGREGGRERLYTVVRHGDKEVWRELVCYEGYERFQEIVKLLKDKYGSRLVDVVPTQASGLYLYGDRLAAIRIVQGIRKSLKP